MEFDREKYLIQQYGIRGIPYLESERIHNNWSRWNLEPSGLAARSFRTGQATVGVVSGA